MFFDELTRVCRRRIFVRLEQTATAAVTNVFFLFWHVLPNQQVHTLKGNGSFHTTYELFSLRKSQTREKQDPPWGSLAEEG